KMIMNSFSSNKSHNLLVIDCESSAEGLNKLDDKLSNIIQNPSKKIILITRENVYLNFQNHGYETKIDTISFNDLEQNSQKDLLGRDIIVFQGQKEKTNLAKLICIDNIDNYLSQKKSQYEL